MAMLKETRDKWVEALRSGDYEQGRDVLCDEENRYCCLGVLNEVMGNKSRTNRMGREYLDAKDEAGDYYCFAMNTYWLESQGVSRDMASRLAKMNDLGMQFVDIAQWIEANVEIQESPSDGL